MSYVTTITVNGRPAIFSGEYLQQAYRETARLEYRPELRPKNEVRAPGKTARERKTGKHAQHLRNRVARAAFNKDLAAASGQRAVKPPFGE